MKIYDLGPNSFQSNFMALILYLGLTTLSLAKADVYVLSLHRVGADGGLTLAMSEKDLESRIQMLLDQGYRFITLESPLSETTSSEKLAAITFDDGYEDVYTHAFPVLKGLSVSATAFVITSSVGKPGFVTWEQLIELQEAGRAIGSHTVSHADLKMLTPESIKNELAQAQHILLEKGLDSSPCLAYPFGEHDNRVRELTRQYHSCAFATGEGLNNITQDPSAYNRPLLLPFGVSWQAQGNDIRSLLFSESLVYWLLPSSDSQAIPQAFYHPARFEMLGSFQFQASYKKANLYQNFFYREGSFAITGQASRWGGDYTEISGVWSGDSVAIGLGWSSYGPVFGVSLPVFDRGEVWLKLGTKNNRAIGASLIPFDYGLVHLELSALSGFNTEGIYALPIFIDQGRPIRLLVGFDDGLYGGVNARVGSFEAYGTISTDAQISFGLKS